MVNVGRYSIDGASGINYDLLIFNVTGADNSFCYWNSPLLNIDIPWVVWFLIHKHDLCYHYLLSSKFENHGATLFFVVKSQDAERLSVPNCDPFDLRPSPCKMVGFWKITLISFRGVRSGWMTSPWKKGWTSTTIIKGSGFINRHCQALFPGG